MGGRWVIPEPVGSELSVLVLRTQSRRQIGEVMKDEGGNLRYGPFKADRDVELLDTIDADGSSVTERVNAALKLGWSELVI